MITRVRLLFQCAGKKFGEVLWCAAGYAVFDLGAAAESAGEHDGSPVDGGEPGSGQHIGVYTVGTATRVATQLAEHGVTRFEEPVSSDDLAGPRHVRAAVSADVTAGE